MLINTSIGKLNGLTHQFNELNSWLNLYAFHTRSKLTSALFMFAGTNIPKLTGKSLQQKKMKRSIFEWKIIP